MAELSTKSQAGNRQQAGKEKEIIVDVKPNSPHYHIYFKTGGQLPKELSGLFVSKRDAEKVIKQYREKKSKK